MLQKDAHYEQWWIYAIVETFPVSLVFFSFKVNQNNLKNLLFCSVLMNAVFKNGMFWKLNFFHSEIAQYKVKKLVKGYVWHLTLNSMTRNSRSAPALISIVHISRFFWFFIATISHWRCSIKRLFLKIAQCSLENTYVGVKPTQVFSCKYCEIFRNTYFKGNLQMAASFFTLQPNV